MRGIRGWRHEAASAVWRVLWAGTVSGLLLTAAGWGVLWRVRILDNAGIILLVVCPGILLAWALRRVKNRRPVRDDILAKQVERNAATADRALAASKGCQRRVEALEDMIARCAQVAEVTDPAAEVTLPGLRAVGGQAQRDLANLCA